MYQTILFDLDGTITDSSEGITKSVQYALKEFGIEETDLKKLQRFIGPPLMDSFIRYYNFSKEDAMKAVEKYRERYKPIGVFENIIYPGIHDLLVDLKSAGKTIALATSKPESFASLILEQGGIKDYFDVIVGSELDGTRSKKEEIIREVFSQLDYDNEQQKNSVMVGDRKHDILGAKACNIDSIGIRYGFSHSEEFEAAGATYILDTVLDLKKFLLE